MREEGGGQQDPGGDQGDAGGTADKLQVRSRDEGGWRTTGSWWIPKKKIRNSRQRVKLK
jgi:hypothetical protein